MNEGMSYKQSKYVNLLERFADSGLAMCEVEINDNELLSVNAADIAARIKTSAKRFGKPHIIAIGRKGKIYLINKLKG